MTEEDKGGTGFAFYTNFLKEDANKHTGTEKNPSLTLESIDEVNDAFDAVELAEDHGINIDE
jgi:hypothetical protein